MTADFGAAGAAVLYGGGAVVLFGVRSWQQKRATGRTGFVAARSRDRWARLAGTGFLTAVGAGMASPVLASVHVVPLLGRGEYWTAGPLAWAGMGVALGGFGLAVAAQQTMGESWRIGVDATERTDLVTHGIFAVVRNPIFTAMIAAQLGTMLMAPTWLSVLGVAALVAGCQVQVRLVEEPYLARVHGRPYLEYASRAGRFLPRLGRLTPPSAAQAVPAGRGLRAPS